MLLLSAVSVASLYLLIGIVFAALSVIAMLSKFFGNMIDRKVEEAIGNESSTITAGFNTELDELKADLRLSVTEKLNALDRKFDTRFSILDNKVSVNGKNTPNIGDSVARSEEKIDLLINTVGKIDDKLDAVSDKLTNHIGWHAGQGDFDKN